jgi:hypothetical protein
MRPIPVQDPVNYRRSWHYWANIHGYYGSQSPDGTVEDQISFLQSHGLARDVKYHDGTAGAGAPITDQTPPDAIAQMVWATCEHGDDSNFFGWHRMYLYYFERALVRNCPKNKTRRPDRAAIKAASTVAIFSHSPSLFRFPTSRAFRPP